jgi:uncharacterized protein
MWLLVAIGIAAGFLSGLFGIGGGVIIVPALIYAAGFTQHKATGTRPFCSLPSVLRRRWSTTVTETLISARR